MIIKEFEEMQVVEMSGIRNAFFHAYVSANKKSFNKPLYPKKPKNTNSKEEIVDIKNTILEIDKQDPNKDWIKLVHQTSKGKGGK